jgi:hypothetical protein
MAGEKIEEGLAHGGGGAVVHGRRLTQPLHVDNIIALSAS